MEELTLEDIVVQLQEVLKDIINKLIDKEQEQLKQNIQEEIIEIYKEE